MPGAGRAPQARAELCAAWGDERRITMTRATYLFGAVLVWAGIFLASSVVLAGTPYIQTMLPILGGGAFWFLVIVPSGMQRRNLGSSPEAE
jgi:hypothetical protein